MNGMPIIGQLNNAVGQNPMKDLTSDNDDSNAINRFIYKQTYMPSQSVPIVQTKKWIGGNRDASSRTTNKRINSTGNNLIIALTGQNSNTNSDHNIRNSALARVRSSGYRVPPKVTNRPGLV